jgi:serine/threonine-protein kinase
MPLDGSSEPERLAPSEQDQHVTSWSSQGVIAYIEKGDIWTVHPPDAPRPFFRSDATEMYATFSPDGRWLAYASSSTGRTEVYVRPYPGPGVAIQVSGSGGSAPSWSLDGRRIYYTSRGAGTTLLAADVTPGDPFRAGRPHPLLDPWPSVGTGPGRSYDVLSDGSFLVCTLPEGGPLKPRFTVTEIHVVLNFFDELNRRDAN